MVTRHGHLGVARFGSARPSLPEDSENDNEDSLCISNLRVCASLPFSYHSFSHYACHVESISILLYMSFLGRLEKKRLSQPAKKPTLCLPGNSSLEQRDNSSTVSVEAGQTIQPRFLAPKAVALARFHPLRAPSRPSFRLGPRTFGFMTKRSPAGEILTQNK
jgi:hypothetical protein